MTDGEFRRSWWHFDFLEGLDGVEGYTADKGIQFHNVETKPRGIKVTSKVDFTNHPMLEDYKFLHDIAGTHTPKMTIPSPNMLFFRGKLGESPYEDLDEFHHDVAQAYKKRSAHFTMPAAAICSWMTRPGPYFSQTKDMSRSKLSAASLMNCASLSPTRLMKQLKGARTI